MNSDFSNCSSSIIDSIRKAGIGRRGGVRIRGGRLPPVKLQSVLPRKKVVAPKIPQRKIKVKKEDNKGSVEECYIKQEDTFKDYRTNSRGRGRGAKVYIQTEGTILGDGPALRIKKEREYTNLDRASFSKQFKCTGIKSEDDKVKSKALESLLESCDDTEIESDSETDSKPIKFPYVKELKYIKKEIDEAEDVKPFIKVEPDEESSENNSNVPIENLFTRIKTEPFPTPNNLVEDVKKMQSKGLMMLLQFPSCLPIDIPSEESEAPNKKQTSSTAKENGEKEEKPKEILKRFSVQDLPEGCIGKFQILKSGKMRFVFGATIIYLEKASSPEFLTEVVSIPLKENEGDIIVLGKIDEKMILRPHFPDITD